MKSIGVSLLATFFLMFLPCAGAQAPATRFQPGEWQIHSIVTPSPGKPIQRQVSVCATSASQTWQAGTANQKCSQPTLTAIANGYNIQIHCAGGAGPVQWKSLSSIEETFSNGGTDLQASGTTTTTVSYAGHPPMTSSATLHATGHRSGICK